MANMESKELDSRIGELSGLRSEMAQLAHRALDGLHPMYRESARNLLHYVALRRHDLRQLQGRLAALGLSSLGRAEAHALGAVDAVLRVLRRLAGRDAEAP